MLQFFKMWGKSTFLAILLCLLSGAANAQFGRNGNPRPLARAADRVQMPGRVESQNLYNALKTQHVATMIKAADLTADWHVISEENPRYVNLGDLFYTKGDVFRFGSEEFLIVYHIVNPSDASQRDALEYYSDQYNKRDSHQSTPQLLKDLQLALSLWPISRVNKLHELATFDPSKDIAQAPPQILLDRNISRSNLKQIGLAMMMYVQDYDDRFPPMIAARNESDIWGAVPKGTPAPPPSGIDHDSNDFVQNRIAPYVRDSQVFLQPVTKHPYLPNYKISRQFISGIKNTAKTFLFYEDAPDANGMRNVVYVDGHVKAISETEFQRQRKAQGISESGYPSAAKPAQKAKVMPKP